MRQKIRHKQSKMGFTLVELVIVIAILAILAAIAIPVITTTINSARISVFESDAATLNMLVKEAINTSKAEIKTTTWNSKNYTTVTIKDILIQNDLINSDDDSATVNFLERTIGNVTYKVVYTKQHDIKITGGVFNNKVGEISCYINGSTFIRDLDKNASGND